MAKAAKVYVLGEPFQSKRAAGRMAAAINFRMAAAINFHTERMQVALEPFADIGQWLFARDVPDDTVVVELSGINGMKGGLTRGHFKAAHTALHGCEPSSVDCDS